jgi:hypothetical protein
MRRRATDTSELTAYPRVGELGMDTRLREGTGALGVAMYVDSRAGGRTDGDPLSVAAASAGSADRALVNH